MRNMIRQKIFPAIISIAFIYIFGTVLPIYADQTQTIKVGIFNRDGYHIVYEDGTHGGYDYEYLQEIAKYTGWKYEFYEGSWTDCRNALEEGKIDLLGGVAKNAERENDFLFADSSSITTTSCLVALSSSEYSYDDFGALEGTRVGVVRDASMNDDLRLFALEKGFSYTEVVYNTMDELKEALYSQAVDCILMRNMRNLTDCKIVAKCSSETLYYIFNKNRMDLKEELDDALEKIHLDDAFFESKLSDKYFSNSTRLAFTKEEKEYIKQNNPFEVALILDYPVLCQYDETTQSYTGIAIDVLDIISKRTGMEFVYTEFPKGESIHSYTKQHPDTLVLPFIRDDYMEYQNHFSTLGAIVEENMVFIYHDNNSILPEQELCVVLTESMYGREEQVRDQFPNAEIIYCDGVKKALDLVESGRADVTLANEISVKYLLQSPYYASLKMASFGGMYADMTFVVGNEANHMLESVLSKILDTFSERDIREIVTDNTYNVYEMSEREWFYMHRTEAVSVLISLIGIVLVLYAINLRRNQKKMFYLANYDELTGLYNERYFEKKAMEWMGKNPQQVYTFFMIDLEKFKMINRLYGRDIGDEVLKQIAAKIKNEVGHKGLYGRYYGDKFVVCYPVGEEHTSKMLRDNIWIIQVRDIQIRVQMQVGAYINKDFIQDVDRILDYIQIAVQKGEDAGKNKFYFFKQEYLDEQLMSQHITNEMDKALREGQFEVHLQPQYHTLSRKLVGAEALIRWNHPEKGMIPPSEFIPVFEENKFIYQLDSFVCDRVCRHLAKWKEKGKIVPVSMNISRVDLNNPDLMDMLLSNLNKYDVPIEYLHLEITESAYVNNQGQMNQVVEELHSKGFVIEMDDFGSGYSSFNMLKDIPIDVLKLDMQFFSDEIHMEKGGNIISSLVNLAHNMGILVVAEGVETEREQQFLRSIHCNIAQGYLYSKPLKLKDFEALLTESEVSLKKVDQEADENLDNMYWRMVEYHELMRDGEAAVYDYDPYNDYAVVTMVNKDGESEKIERTRYVETLMENETIHPEDRMLIKSVLQTKAGERRKVRFRGDYINRGYYSWYHANIQNYYKNGQLSRVIAVIKPETN